ncbi:hypothetical protein V3391_11225 [Luteimonas sp. SMYT11W]|uniref:Uncharacterized protein n=1 Tax=Luteimonas flava TaxID=3115822 RepID=A0ABU7WGQ2_9GAMM
MFHLGLWLLFDWPRTLQPTTRANRAIVQIANAQLVWVFGAVALRCFLMPGDLDIIPARTDAARRDGRRLVAEIGFAVLPAARA